MSLWWHGDPWVEFGGADRPVDGGMGALVDKIASPLKDQINLNKKVVSIKHGKDYCKVRTKDEVIYEADVCIVTIPLGVLKRPSSKGGIKFSPSLPTKKRAAISRSEMGLLSKLFLIFDKVYWPKEDYLFLFMSNTNFSRQIFNVYYTHGKPILAFL